MASNLALTPVKDSRILTGFGNIFRMSSHQWWGTRRWLKQLVLWLLVVNVPWAGSIVINFLAAKLGVASKFLPQSGGSAGETLMMFFIMGGLFTSIGVIILGQDAIIQGRQNGTIAWLLSKPVSRSAFILSRLLADAGGILVVMVLAQGLVAYVVCRFVMGLSVSILGFLASMAVFFLHQLFYLGLSFMLGSLFRSRGPVLAIPLAFIFTYNAQQKMGLIGNFLPWNLVLGPQDNINASLSALLVDGVPLPTVAPIIGTAALTLVFILVAMWRFSREEF